MPNNLTGEPYRIGRLHSPVSYSHGELRRLIFRLDSQTFNEIVQRYYSSLGVLTNIYCTYLVLSFVSASIILGSLTTRTLANEDTLPILLLASQTYLPESFSLMFAIVKKHLEPL